VFWRRSYGYDLLDCVSKKIILQQASINACELKHGYTKIHIRDKLMVANPSQISYHVTPIIWNSLFL
jgi:hypothetical protein